MARIFLEQPGTNWAYIPNNTGKGRLPRPSRQNVSAAYWKRPP
jgi:hypothetical protein